MIEGYLGRPGAGKSYCMVARASKFIGKRPIFGNFTPPEDNRWFEPFKNLEDLLGIRNALVLMDEIGLWFGARKWKETPESVLSYFAQSRKNGVDMWFTAQSDMQVESSIRRLTATYWAMQRYGPFILARGTDPLDSKAKAFCSQWFKIRPSVYALYDTYEIVGNSEGEGYGRGARSKAEDTEAFVKAVTGWQVRAGGCGRPYHQFTVADLADPDISVVRKVGGRWELVPDSDIDVLREGIHRAGASRSVESRANNVTDSCKCPVCGSCVSRVALQGVA